MRFFYLILLALLTISNAFADNSYEPLLNTVNLQLYAEQWVTTKTALVTVGVNASVSGQGLEKIQANVLSKLNQISNKGEWHIVSFNRSLDQSGLERVQISAQARLASADLAGLRDRAKAISKPGETYTLDNVEFVPSSNELRDANTALRNDIYNQIKIELANLSKQYPEQKYYVHNINFLGEFSPAPQPMLMKAAMVGSVANERVASLSVGDKLKLSATVVLAAAPNGDVTKIVHN